MTAWLVILAVGAGSYALRSSMLVLSSSRELPARVEAALSLVAPAAVGALVATMLFTGDGEVAALPWPELVAVGCGFLAVHRTGNVLHAFVAGMPVLWVLTALAG
jgi:branched-subunit amino acid transport protein